jgi:hypothetical protein
MLSQKYQAVDTWTLLQARSPLQHLPLGKVPGIADSAKRYIRWR